MTKIIVFLFILLTGCERMIEISATPYGVDKGMIDGAPPGTEAFRAGWQDGCESGISTSGSMHHKAFNQFRFRSEFAESNKEYNDLNTDFSDNEYYNGWRMAFNHCRYYNARWYLWGS